MLSGMRSLGIEAIFHKNILMECARKTLMALVLAAAVYLMYVLFPGFLGCRERGCGKCQCYADFVKNYTTLTTLRFGLSIPASVSLTPVLYSGCTEKKKPALCYGTTLFVSFGHSGIYRLLRGVYFDQLL